MIAGIGSLALLLAGTAHADLYRTGQVVMGTILNVTVEAADPTTAHRLGDEAVAIARHWDDVLTTWRSEGELARLNHQEGARSAISDDLRLALRQMEELHRATHGAFDPAVGPLVDLWRTPHTPSRQRLWARPVGLTEVLDLDQKGARLVHGAALDAGGIGKGIALDAIRTHLQSQGADAAFLDFGGSSQLAFVRKGVEHEPWQIAIAGMAVNSVLGTLALSSGALSTSRSSRPGEPAGPIVDPRNRQTVHAERLITVLAKTATAADAWSTALVVTGRKGIDVARSAGIAVLLEDEKGVVRTDDFPLVAARDDLHHAAQD